MADALRHWLEKIGLTQDADTLPQNSAKVLFEQLQCSH
jgi:hypothetical protein